MKAVSEKESDRWNPLGLGTIAKRGKDAIVLEYILRWRRRKLV
jgi:hypothetical protein